MATYKDIQRYIKLNYNCTVKSCWIAHMKSICGIHVKIAHNRKNPNRRVFPCPDSKKDIIKEAFRHFDMI